MSPDPPTYQPRSRVGREPTGPRRRGEYFRSAPQARNFLSRPIWRLECEILSRIQRQILPTGPRVRILSGPPASPLFFRRNSATNTAVLEKFGFDPKTMPMKPMSVEQCVSEGLGGLLKNRSRIVPGRLNRIMNALVPASLARKMEADMLGKGLSVVARAP